LEAIFKIKLFLQFILTNKRLKLFLGVMLIDAQGLKIQGRGYLTFFAKIPGGGQGFQEKLPGGSPYFGFYCYSKNERYTLLE
jgi:hypothetical protein